VRLICAGGVVGRFWLILEEGVRRLGFVVVVEVLSLLAAADKNGLSRAGVFYPAGGRVTSLRRATKSLRDWL
jgi:hypothetical protein